VKRSKKKLQSGVSPGDDQQDPDGNSDQEESEVHSTLVFDVMIHEEISLGRSHKWCVTPCVHESVRDQRFISESFRSHRMRTMMI
jgi:hypothetical protein